MPTHKDFVAIARVVRPQGRRGEVFADILTDFPEKFAERSKLWLAADEGSPSRELTLQEHWFHKGRVVLKFLGIESISEAEALIGMLVEIPREDRSQLQTGSIYVSDLLGSTLVDCSVEPVRSVGAIAEVRQGSGAAPLLVVRNDAREYEIPFAEEYVLRFDEGTKTLEMKLPEGMLEINAPLSEDEKREHNNQSYPR